MRVILTCADKFENCQIFCNCLDWLDSGLIVLLISSEWILGYDCFNWFRLNGFWVIYLAGFLGIEFCFYIWILFLVLHPGRNQSLVLTDSRQCKAKFQRRCGHRLEILTKQWRESGCNKLWFLPGWSTRKKDENTSGCQDISKIQTGGSGTDSFWWRDCFQNQPEHTGRRFFWRFKTGYAVSEICKQRDAKCVCRKYTAGNGRKHKQAP